MSRIWLSLAHMGGAEQDFVREAFDTNWVVPLGPNVDGFERDLEAWLSQHSRNEVHVVALASGTSAIHLALVMLGIAPGDEVICQSFTFAASANPICYQGATPVFVDSEPGTWNMDPELLEQAICDRLEKTGRLPKAIIPVHLYGVPARMNEIMPYYNKLYVSESYEKLPIEDVDFYEDLMNNKAGNENVTGSNQNAVAGNVQDAATDSHVTTDNGSYNKHDLERYHDTPQGRLNDLTNSEYLTSMTQNDGSGTNANTRNNSGYNNRTTNNTENSSGNYDRETSKTSVESETKHIHGKMHSESYNKLMADYRKNLLNIDMLIINDLEELFIQLW